MPPTLKVFPTVMTVDHIEHVDISPTFSAGLHILKYIDIPGIKRLQYYLSWVLEPWADRLVQMSIVA